MGLAEHELKPIVDAWRVANLNIVQLWADVEQAAIAAITSRQPIRLRILRFSVESGVFFIEIPSGRRLAHVQPRLGENRWVRTSITYTGTTTGRRWAPDCDACPRRASHRRTHRRGVRAAFLFIKLTAKRLMILILRWRLDPHHA